MDEPEDSLPLRFGSYEIILQADGRPHELGRGGFGRTFRARHLFLGKIVALKVINERLAGDETAKRRFLEEAQEHSALDHPGIARLTDFGEQDGLFFYAMEFCSGGDLEKYVREHGSFSPSKALPLIRQIAEALRFAHGHGVTHCDVKPANLLLVRREDNPLHVKLIDFGLAKRFIKGSTDTDRPDETGDHFSAGPFSATFASPEQILKKSPDGRSDIFSLGMTAWFLIEGGVPVEGTPWQIAQDRARDEEYEPRLPGSLTGQFRVIVAHMLEKNASSRYQTCDDLLADLDGILGQIPGEPEHHHPGTASEGTPPSIVSRFEMEPCGVTGLGECFTGYDRKHGTRVSVTRFHTRHPVTVIREVEDKVRRLTSSPPEGLVPVLEMTEFSEGWALVERYVEGVPLAAVIRANEPFELSAIARVLLDAAEAVDFAVAASVEPVPLEEALLEGAREGEPVDWSSVQIRIGVQWTMLPGRRDAELGLTAAPLDASPLQSFASLLYFATGGRRVHDNALYAFSAYVPISGLNGRANRTLAACLSGEREFAGCRSLLRAIFNDEDLSSSRIERRPAQRKETGGSLPGPVEKADGPPAFQGVAPIAQPVNRPAPRGPHPPENGFAGKRPRGRSSSFAPKSGSSSKRLLYGVGVLLLAGISIWAVLKGRGGPVPVYGEQSDDELPYALNHPDITKKAKVPLPGGARITLRWIPPGHFTMGSPVKEIERGNDETQAEVTLTKGFWLAETETTQAQWTAIVENNPSYHTGETLPVERVNWKDVESYINALNIKSALPSGWKWALPTEAQWEYACRAGTSTVFSCGDTLTTGDANFNGTQPYGTAPEGAYLKNSRTVGFYAPNPWGLFDMHGNVWEWCLDSVEAGADLAGGKDPLSSTGSLRVYRGGSWRGGAENCRSAHREKRPPQTPNYNVGFRTAIVPVER